MKSGCGRSPRALSRLTALGALTPEGRLPSPRRYSRWHRTGRRAHSRPVREVALSEDSWVRPFSAVRHRPRREVLLAAPGRGDAVSSPWPLLREVGLRSRGSERWPHGYGSCLLGPALAGPAGPQPVRGRLPPPVLLRFTGAGQGHPSGSFSRQTAPSKRFSVPPAFLMISEPARAPCPAPAVPRPISRPFRVPAKGNLATTCRRQPLALWGTGSRQLLFDPRFERRGRRVFAKDPDVVRGLTRVARLIRSAAPRLLPFFVVVTRKVTTPAGGRGDICLDDPPQGRAAKGPEPPVQFPTFARLPGFILGISLVSFHRRDEPGRESENLFPVLSKNRGKVNPTSHRRQIKNCVNN